MNCYLCHEIQSSFTSYMHHLTIHHGTPPVFKYTCTACIPSTLFQDIHRFKRHVAGQHLHLFDSLSQTSHHKNQRNVYENLEENINPTTIETDHGDDLLNEEPETMKCEEKVIENMHLNENDILELRTKLRENVYKFTLSLYSKPNLTRKDVVEIQKNVTEEIIKPIYNIFTSIASISDNEAVKNLLNDLREPFNFIATEQKFNSATQNLGLRDSLHTINFENSEGQILSKGCLMPIKHQIRLFFESPNVLSKTLENINHLEQEDSLKNVVNGSLWKSIKAKVGDKIIVPYFLYSDEAEMNDAIGAHSGTHKVCSIYYSFPTIPSHLLSRLDNIFVAGFIKASDMSEYGPSNVLQDLIDILVDLESNGLNLMIEGTAKEVQFVLLGILGDNLGINTLMGFAASFSALFYCRFCKMNKYDAQNLVTLDPKLKRAKENYEEDLIKSFKESGIKENSKFNTLKYYHVADFAIVDAMHDLYSHGICNYEISLVLDYMIQKLQISLQTINYKIQMFNYGETEKRNMFKKITREQIKSTNFKMTAREMMMFVHYLPLIFGELIPLDNEVWNFVLSLVELADLILLPSFDNEMIKVLEDQIIYHHSLYMQVFDQTLKPKHHLLLHYVQTIEKIGPPRHTWSFRFEATHQTFKKYCRSITSRRNICLTLCKKANLIFINNINNSSHFQEHLAFKKAVKLKLISLPYFSELELNSELLTSSFYASNFVSYRGTDYKVGYFLTISKLNMRTVKVFEIKDLLVKDELLFVACQQWDVKGYVNHFASFEVSLPQSRFVIMNVNQFDGPPVHLYNSANNNYVRLKKFFV